MSAYKHIRKKLSDDTTIFGKNYSHVRPRIVQPPHVTFSLESREPVLTKDSPGQYLETWVFEIMDKSEADVEALADNLEVLFDEYSGTEENVTVKYAILQEQSGEVIEQEKDKVFVITQTYLFRVAA